MRRVPNVDVGGAGGAGGLFRFCINDDGNPILNNPFWQEGQSTPANCSTDACLECYTGIPFQPMGMGRRVGPGVPGGAEMAATSRMPSRRCSCSCK